jgi:hypothetical protein
VFFSKYNCLKIFSESNCKNAQKTREQKDIFKFTSFPFFENKLSEIILEHLKIRPVLTSIKTMVPTC